MKSAVYILVALIVGVITGWFSASKLSPGETSTSEVVRYVYKPVTRVEGVFPAAVKVRPLRLPSLSLVDSVVVREQIPVDTAAIVADYCVERGYLLDFSTDTTGVFKVSATVAYNRLTAYSAEIRPLERQSAVTTTVIKSRLFSPFVMAGTSLDLKVQQVTAGVSIRNKYMVAASGLRLGDKHGYTVNFGYQF